MIKQTIDRVTRRHFIHVAINCLGLYPVAALIFATIAAKISGDFPDQVSPFMSPFFYPEKKFALIGYVASCATLAAYVAINVLFQNNPHLRRNYAWNAPKYSLRNLTLALGISLLAWINQSSSGNFIYTSIAAMVVLNTAFPFAKIILNSSSQFFAPQRFPLSSKALTCLLLAHLCLILPLILLKPIIGNEYYNISSNTKLSDHKADQSSILSDYDAAGRFPGIGLRKWNPEIGGFENLAQTYPSQKIILTPKLKSALNAIDTIIPDQVNTLMRNNPPPQRFDYNAVNPLTYDESTGTLIAVGPLSQQITESIKNLVEASERERIDRLALDSRTWSQAQLQHVYSDTEREYIQKNFSELTNQILARRMLHHHNFLFGPIVELHQGRKLDEINLQYGYFFALCMERILTILGDVSFQSYFKLLYLFYPLYFLLAIFVVMRTTGDKKLWILFACICLANQGFIGYTALATAPGLNPVRHICDFATLGLLWYGLRCKNMTTYSLSIILVYILCFIALLNNKQTGIFLLLSTSLTLASKSFIEAGIRNVSLFSHIVVAIAGLAGLAYIDTGKDFLSAYYIMGLCGFPTKEFSVFAFILLTASTYLVLIGGWRSITKEDRYLLLACSLYSQAMFIYYIWVGTRHHLMNYIPVYAYNAVLLIKASSSLKLSWPLPEHREKITAAVGSLACLLALIGVFNYVFEYAKFMKSMQQHELHEWHSSMVKIVSPMPEEPFTDSVNLIKKYNKNPNIYIISEYDALIPRLANGYSAMPFPDLQWFLNSKNEISACIDKIKQDKPEFLFVDRGIERDFFLEVPDSTTPIFNSLQAEGILRAHRLTAVQSIFLANKPEYDLIDTGYLLNVWKRKLR